MRAIALVLSLAALAGCAMRAAHEPLQVRDLLGHKTAVRTDRAGAPLPASTCAIRAEADVLPPEALPLVASLLERRGWTLSPDAETAEVTFRLSDGSIGGLDAPSGSVGGATPVVRGGSGPVFGDMQQGFNGSGDVLYRNHAGRSVSTGGAGFVRDSAVRRLEVAASMPQDDDLWSGLAWVHALRAESVDDLNDLALSFADRLPTPKHASVARATAGRLGTDYVMILGTDRRLVPVLLGVAPGSAAARAGWQPRDVLVSIDGEPVAGRSWTQIAERLAAAESRPVEVELLRAGERYLTFLVPTTPRPLG